MFEEVEHTCDKVALIKGGKLVAIKKLLRVTREQYNKLIIRINDANINSLFRVLALHNDVERHHSWINIH
jgi:ABC-2 type transport system ATP-binding protein